MVVRVCRTAEMVIGTALEVQRIGSGGARFLSLLSSHKKAKILGCQDVLFIEQAKFS